MNRLITAVGASIALAVLSACGDRTLNPKAPDPALVGGAELAFVRGPDVRISEFHYDNGTTDLDEQVELSGPAGTRLDGWKLVLYNGNPGSRSPYSTISLDGLEFPTSCGSRGVVVVPTPGIQDAATSRTSLADPDGIALIHGTTVVDALAYEGSFVAVGGDAADRTFSNIGVREKAIAPEPAGRPVWSLKRSITNTWSGPSLNDFGTCNDNTAPAPQVVDHLTVTPVATSAKVGETLQFTATAFDASNAVVDEASISWSSSAPMTATIDPPTGLVTAVQVGDVTITAQTPNGVTQTATLTVEAAGLPDIRFSELHYDFPRDNQAIEIEGPPGTVLGAGWSIAFYDGDVGKMYGFQDIPEGTEFPAADTCGRAFLYQFLGSRLEPGPDAIALVKPSDADHPYQQVVELLSYEGTFTAVDGPAEGKRSVDIGKAELRNLGGSGSSIQRKRDGTGWFGPGPNTFGGCNNNPPPPPTNPITFVGRGPTDPSLPVGFEDQLFATERDGADQIIPTTFTWTTETPDIATIDMNGVVHAWQAGTATVRATAADGASATWSLSFEDPQPSGSAVWGGNLEFGQPIGANDLVIARNQFTASFSRARRIPNWVSAKLEASHFGAAEDLCDCYTYDPQLGLPMMEQYTTANYPAPSGVVAAFERGHLLRSADLTVSDGDNKFAYLFTNVVPMSHNLRVGAWASLDTYLGGLARSGKDVYLIAGSSGSTGTVRNEGKVTIPSSLWKVAVIMPHGQGFADVHTAADVNVVAAIMPNDASVGSDWLAYKTTVDAVEALSGFDLLHLLEDQLEMEVESGSRRPVAALDGPYSALEGGSVAMSAAASSDPDGDALTYQWAFSDGSTASGVSVSHTYPQQGTYTVALTVTESHGLAATTTSTVSVANVAPAIGPFSGATLRIGDTYGATGAFTDPGADSWTASVNYGDGTTAPLALSGNSFSLSHTYTAYGTFTVTVSVFDGTETSSRSQTVLVRAYPVAKANGPYASNEGESVALSAAGSSDPDGSIQSYAWDFGDGTSGTGASVTHTYAQDGSYPVRLTVTDNDGLTAVSNATASVANVAPALSDFAGATIAIGDSYSASGSFTDPGADSWTATVNYGDGATTALVLNGKSYGLSHVYGSLGTFTVTVSVSDGVATSTKTKQVRVLARPVAALNGPYSTTEGAAVAMSGAQSLDEDGTIQSYAWNFGDGSTGAGANVSHTYMRDGSYSVTLTVTDNDGLTDVETATVTVANVAPAIANFPGGIQLRGETYAANGSFTDPGDDSWSGTVDYGDGSGAQALAIVAKTFALSHVYSTLGTFTVTVRISDGAVTSVRTQTVVVRAKPVAAVNGPFTSTEGAAVAMSASSSSDPDGTIQSYAWSFGDGASGSGVNASHVYVQDGSYAVTLTVTDNDGLTAVATTTVTVSNVAPVVAQFTGGAAFVGEIYSASGSFTDPGADSWSATVDYGDGSSGPLTLSGKSFALSHAYARPGSFTVVVTVSDGTAGGSKSAVVTVRAKPIATISGTFASFEGSSIAMSASGSSDADGTIRSYAWTFGDGSSASGASVSHTYVQDGAYVVTLTVTDNDGLTGTTTSTAQVANVAPIVPTFTDKAILQGEAYSVSTSFIDPGADVWTASVDFGDGRTSPLVLSGKAFSFAHTYTSGGTYTLTVRVSDDDATTVRTATINVMSIAQALQWVLGQCGDINSLQNKIESAIKQFDKGKASVSSTTSHLESFLKELDKAVRSGEMTAAQAARLREVIQRVLSALTGQSLPSTPQTPVTIPSGPVPAPVPAPRPPESIPRSPVSSPRNQPAAPRPSGPNLRSNISVYPSNVVLPPATVRAILMSFISLWGT